MFSGSLVTGLGMKHNLTLSGSVESGVTCHRIVSGYRATGPPNKTATAGLPAYGQKTRRLNLATFPSRPRRSIKDHQLMHQAKITFTFQETGPTKTITTVGRQDTGSPLLKTGSGFRLAMSGLPMAAFINPAIGIMSSKTVGPALHRFSSHSQFTSPTTINIAPRSQSI